MISTGNCLNKREMPDEVRCLIQSSSHQFFCTHMQSEANEDQCATKTISQNVQET